MKDITMYSDNELSLQVFNDPYFFYEIHNPNFVVALVKEEFVFTDNQLENLIYDINQYIKDIEIQKSLARGEAQ